MKEIMEFYLSQAKAGQTWDYRQTGIEVNSRDIKTPLLTP